ncbi:MAG TPA: hypothetical protein VJP02_07600 [Candidatus Sulfotelmatobacter sp.]|nr:hypothetical protein [Candidatus Sulfotelmatobacter sp.]
MRSARLLFVTSAALLVFSAVSSDAQNAQIKRMVPEHVRKEPVNVHNVQKFSSHAVLSVRTGGTLPGTSERLLNGPVIVAVTTTGAGGTIAGLDTVPTFSGAFAAQNGPTTDDPFPLGNVFPFIMVGNEPLAGGTTTIPTKITEVSLTLLNPDGSVNTTVNFTKTFDDVMTDSPNYAVATYDSSQTPTQFADAVQRASFFYLSKPNWHTRLGGPTIVNHVTWTIPASVNVQFADGTVEAVQAYYTGTAADGSTFVLLLNLLFNAEYDNQVVNDIVAGNFTSNAMNQDWLPNTFLFSANEANPNVPGNCCVLGFHTYFYEPGVTPQPRWLTLFASYISPGLFGGGFQDVTAMSHEISETYADPFLSNRTPVWQFPGGSTSCQGNLETGDPVEVLANATVPITLTEGLTILTFHPQTEALLQWFEMGATSNAIGGAFSYPDKTALTASAAPCP